jgi:hypothetical protein
VIRDDERPPAAIARMVGAWTGLHRDLAKPAFELERRAAELGGVNLTRTAEKEARLARARVDRPVRCAGRGESCRERDRRAWTEIDLAR